MSTSLLPEPLAAVKPEPKPVKKRVSWTQAEVVALVQSHAKSPANLADLSAPGRTHAECVAKVIALGLVAKPEKAALEAGTRTIADHALSYFVDLDEPQLTLAIRYAIKSLQALLPKRPAK